MAGVRCRSELFGRRMGQSQMDVLAVVISEADVVCHVPNPDWHMAQDCSAESQ